MEYPPLNILDVISSAEGIIQRRLFLTEDPPLNILDVISFAEGIIQLRIFDT